MARVGIDLVSISSVRESLENHGTRYLERVYTEAEVRACRGTQGIDPERLAARFAAKEATLKVLRPANEQAIPWRTIEVVSQPSGWVELKLSGPAAAAAVRAGLGDFALSITHEGDYASAVVVADEGFRNGPDGPMMNT
jgi:holo-[acyl-carrier protein] synthase